MQYCRLWIEAYAQKTKGLYLKLLGGEPYIHEWTEKEKELTEKLKQSLMRAPILAVPTLKKPFISSLVWIGEQHWEY